MATGCQARNRAGEPCSAAVYQDGWCRWHQPGREAEERRREWARRGGVNRSNRARARREMAEAAMTPAELQGYLAVALRGVIAGKYTPGQGSAVAALARAAVAVREASEWEQRLEALEAVAGVEPRRMA